MILQKHKSKLLVLAGVLIGISLICLYLFNSSVKEITDIVFISFVLAYILSPIKEFFEERVGLDRRVSSIVVIVIVITIVVLGIAMILPGFIKELSSINDVFDDLTLLYEDIIQKFNLNNAPEIEVFYNLIVEKSNRIWMNFSENIFDNILETSSKAISLAVIPIITYYFMCDGTKMFSRMLLFLPTERRDLTEKIVKDINKFLKRYICSQLYLCGIIGILTFILLILLGIRFPLWIAVLNGLFNIIPYFGPIFGMIPAVFIAFILSPSKALWVLAGMILIQQIEGNILSPKITGDNTEMHPVVIIILLLIGDKFGGFMGMIIIVPIAVIIKVLYDDINYYFF